MSYLISRCQVTLSSGVIILMLFAGSGLSEICAAQTDKNEKTTINSESRIGLGKYLNEFSPQARKLLESEISKEQFDGVISTELVEQLLQLEEGSPGTVQELMQKLLPLASQYAMPPISNFRVGAISQGKSGALYLGANLEIEGAALGFTLHAEQSAVNNALLHAETGIERIAVTAAPCGHCRQFLNELEAASKIEIIVVGRRPVALDKLLPEAFGPKALGLDHALFSKNKPPVQCPLAFKEDMACHGVEAIRYSYAPYSESPSSITLKVKDKLFYGAYLENIAFNPSLPPLLSALERLRFEHIGFSEIEEAILVESKEARISQESYTKAILKEIAPSAEFRLVEIDKTSE